MHHIKTGISAREIMDENFPIMDNSVPLIKCVKKMNNRHGACIIIKNGDFLGVLSNDDILRGFMYGKDKYATVDNVEIRKNFAVVKPESDVYKTLSLMKEEDVDFVLVKDGKDLKGLITKREIAEVEPILFENLGDN